MRHAETTKKDYYACRIVQLLHFLLVNVVYADEFSRPDFNQMIQTTFRLLKEYNITCDSRCRIFVDGANPSFIRALKDRVDEDSEYEKQLAFYKKSYASIYDLEFLQHNVFVILVPFSKYHKEMLSHCKETLEYQNGRMAIHPRFTKLIISLRNAVENDGNLDKEATSHDDILDSLRLSMMFWH